MLEVEVTVFEDIDGLVSQYFSGVVFQDVVETFGHLKLLSVLARHYRFSYKLKLQLYYLFLILN